ncbi:MAG: (2R)-3-sulfolactate dehydrogenase (NADP+) [Hyphomicrobiaceae bacterium]|jgi:(2R)-3-sulfolactate dehydrogenase (NADP+)
MEGEATGSTASRFGYEPSSFFSGDGDPTRIGQFMIAIDPASFSNSRFGERLDELLVTIKAQPGTRLPGERQFELRKQVEQSGIVIVGPLGEQLQNLPTRPL